jgi:hypothetical protein
MPDDAAMKRDMELVRKMLLAVEAEASGYAPNPLAIDSYTEEQIGYHAYLIADAGLAEGIDQTTMGSPSPEYQLRHLTSSGHDFLDAAREPSRWQKAMAKVADAGGSITIGVLQRLLASMMKDSLGLSPGD